MASCSPGRRPVAVIIPVRSAARDVSPAWETWLVIWVMATRLTAATTAPIAPRPAARSRPGQRRTTYVAAIHTASRPRATAVASRTLAWFQFWVSTAGSAKLNA